MLAVARNLIRGSPLIIALLCGVTTTFAKDLDVLVRITYAAFLSEQGSAMCNLPRLPLSNDDRTVFANAKSYANWIKQQIGTGLTDDEAQYVFKSAADRARAEMLQVVDVLKSYPPDQEAAELLKWCTGPMKAIADQVVGAYVRRSELIEQIIKKAKEN